VEVIEKILRHFPADCPPTLITQSFLVENDIKNMEELSANMPQFAHADVAMTEWMPRPAR